MYVWFSWKFDSKKFLGLFIVSFLIELTLCSQISAFIRNVNDHWSSSLIELTLFSQISAFIRNANDHWKFSVQKNIFQTILVIIGWNFTMLKHRVKLEQVKTNLISSITKQVHKLPLELQNHFKLWKLRNSRKNSHLTEDTA